MIERTFRLFGILEAISIVALFGVAMPMKYAYGVKEATQVPGLVHGLLFIGYVVLATVLANQERWSKKQLGYAYLASVVPLGTLAFDWKYLGRSRIKT